MQGYNCILIYKDDQVLFCKRTKDPYKGKYNLPGGKIEVGEDGFHAAYRELAEETGITHVELSHMMDFTYYNQGCYVEIYVGKLNHEVELVYEKHPLCWLSSKENFFDLEKFAGEGNIGHIMEQVSCYGLGVFQYAKASKASFNRVERILCYGDSNTFGWNPMTGLRYEEDVRWTGILQKKLGSSYRILEEGCNGRTTIFEKPEEPWKSGLLTLKPVLNTCKPVHRMILMLGSNDLKTMFHASPKDVADGLRQLVITTIEFTKLKQGFVPKILIVSPCEIGQGVENGPMGYSFDDTAHNRSLLLAPLYEAVADEFSEHCQFLDAGKVIKPSSIDMLHLMPDAHKALAEKLFDSIMEEI